MGDVVQFGGSRCQICNQRYNVGHVIDFGEDPTAPPLPLKDGRFLPVPLWHVHMCDTCWERVDDLDIDWDSPDAQARFAHGHK